MTRVTDLFPLAPPAFDPLPAQSAAASASSWFNDDSARPMLRIGVEIDPASRGLSVEQHAQCVLGALCGEPDGR